MLVFSKLEIRSLFILFLKDCTNTTIVCHELFHAQHDKHQATSSLSLVPLFTMNVKNLFWHLLIRETNPMLPVSARNRTLWTVPKRNRTEYRLDFHGFLMNLDILMSLAYGLYRNIYGCFWSCKHIGIAYVILSKFGAYLSLSSRLLRWTFPHSLAIIRVYLWLSIDLAAASNF